MKNYDSFAPFYDLAMGDRKEVAKELLKIFKEHHPRARSLLEFGCGTGSLIKVLSKKYKCFGIDQSAGMVKEARLKVPGVTFTTFNIANEIPPSQPLPLHSFDIVLCAFDTINHITTFSGWKEVFKNARRFLRPGGIFVFDINTERKLTRYYEEPPFADCKENSTAVFQVFKYPKGRFNIEVQVFKRKSGAHFTMKEMVVEEATFPVPKIVAELARHFKSVHVLDLERNSPSAESEELYFICS